MKARSLVHPSLSVLHETVFSPGLHSAFNQPTKTISRFCIVAAHCAIYRHAQSPKRFDRQVSEYILHKATPLFTSEFDRKVWLELRRIYSAVWYTSETWLANNAEGGLEAFIRTEMYAAEPPDRLDLDRVCTRLREVRDKYLAGCALTEA
jgi:hypothetical protein